LVLSSPPRAWECRGGGARALVPLHGCLARHFAGAELGLTPSCKNCRADCVPWLATVNMDFLHTIKLLVEENDTAICATQQAIMRIDFLFQKTLQQHSVPSESISQELSILFQEKK